MKIFWTDHALERLSERSINQDEVEYALERAKVVLPGKNPGTSRVIVDIAFGRKLCVVYKDHPERRVIITTYWV